MLMDGKERKGKEGRARGIFKVTVEKVGDVVGACKHRRHVGKLDCDEYVVGEDTGGA